MATLGDLSIIIPAWNAAHCIERTLQSLVEAGANAALEIIVVDDGSSDDTALRAQRFVTDLPRLRVLCQANRGPGPGGARNQGLLHSQGRYVHFVDADDTLVNNAYRVLGPSLDSNPAMVDFDYWRENRRGAFHRKTSLSAVDIDNGVVGEGGVIRSGMVWSALIRRDLAEQVPFPEATTYEDDPVIGLLPFLAAPVVKVRKALYCYRHDPRSITRSPSRQQFHDREAMARAYAKNGRLHGLDRRFREAFEYRYFRMFANSLWTAMLASGFPDRHSLALAHGAKVRQEFPRIEENRFFRRQSLRKRLGARLLMSPHPGPVRLPELLFTRRIRWGSAST